MTWGRLNDRLVLYATVSWPRCLLRTLTKRSISCRESFFSFSLCEVHQVELSQNANPSRSQLFQKKLSAFKQCSTILPSALCGWVLKICHCRSQFSSSLSFVPVAELRCTEQTSLTLSPLHLSVLLIFPLSTDWISNLPICIWNWVESKISRGALTKSSYTHMYTQTCLSLSLAVLFTKFHCTERLSGVFELATRSELCCVMNITALH